MKPHEIREELRKTLLDGSLSRTEKRAVKKLVESASFNDRALLRSMAFEIAREHLGASDTLEWLEDVVKAVAPSQETAPPSSRAYFSPGDAPLKKLLELIGSAKKHCDICVFTITDNRISDAIERCHSRGVNVRIITDDDKAFDKGSDIRRFEAHGLSVRTDHGKQHMHHKFAVFDRAILVTGSYNWTRSAASRNYENVVVTEEAELVSPFCDLFERLWNELE